MLCSSKAAARCLFVTLILAFATNASGDDAQAARLALLKTFRDEFVPLTPGEGQFPASFTMGADNPSGADKTPADKAAQHEGPAHKVSIAHRFAVARYEVPQNLWEAVMDNNPSRWKGKRNSVEMVNYDDALDFCRRATTAMRRAQLIGNDEVVRLPSEAEWEYAARAGSTGRYSFGDDAEKLGDYGWFHGNAAGNDPPVGAKKANNWKLYDVHGYLWEWCSDRWHDSYAGAPADGSAWAAGDDGRRVLRGGSWKDPADRLTSTSRRGADATLRDDAVGLRCVLAREEASGSGDRLMESRPLYRRQPPTPNGGLRPSASRISARSRWQQHGPITTIDRSAGTASGLSFGRIYLVSHPASHLPMPSRAA
ncbi:MAG TPA: formylglycine-generating enzyme family protein [Pirellulales bacterium]|nr:formylglycine-generating enzyme family protein [Pirellulales bacterium]